jgi:alpha-1,2-mannosyltransferase
MVERIAVTAVMTALAAPPLYVGLRAAGVPGAPLAVALVLGGGGLWLARRLPASLDGAWRRRRTLAFLWLLISAVAVVQMTRLSIFMLDGTRRQQSMLPLYDTIAEHSCLSAYHRASELSRRSEGDLYDPGAYTGKIGAGNFKVERYEYPPPFLLLPRLLGAITGHDFLRLRALWFAVMALPLMLALGLLARHVEHSAAGLLAPAVMASMPVMLSLQYGNFHVAAVALAVLGMLALRERGGLEIAGGALLAFATVAKLFPGLLLVALAAQRRWRALGWTVAWLVAWTLLSVIALGPAPMADFLQLQLGRVATGAAFPFMADNERVVAANMSIHALVWKLGLLLGHPSAVAARVASWLFAGALVAVVALAARRRERLAEGQLWLAALFLGGLCSPFAPNPYAQLALLWLLTLLVPQALPHRGQTVALAGAWLAASVMVYALPLHAGPALLGLSLVGQVSGMAVAAWALLRRRAA